MKKQKVMRIGVQATSLEAYTELQFHLGEHQQTVYAIIQKYPNVSDSDIERIAKLRINDVTGRRNELEKMGLITYNGEKVDRLTGRKVMKWISAR